MNKKYFFFWIPVFMVSIMFLLSCIKEHVTDITLNKNEIFLSPDGTETLIVTIYPDDADNKNVKWKSSNPNVATVTNKGLVTAIKDGKANITVTTKDGKKTVSCSVNVDYRGKWTGSYDCEVNGSTWVLDLNGGYTEYYTYQTEVTITAIMDSILLICDTEKDDSYEVKVNILGYFSAPQNHGSIQGTFFETDSIKMSIMYGMQGFSVSKNFKGKKIKK